MSTEPRKLVEVLADTIPDVEPGTCFNLEKTLTDTLRLTEQVLYEAGERVDALRDKLHGPQPYDEEKDRMPDCSGLLAQAERNLVLAETIALALTKLLAKL